MTATRKILLIATTAFLTATGAAQAVSFIRADGNNDGFVTYDEARRVFSGLSDVHYGKVDTNDDGVIDESEFPRLEAIYESLYERP